MEEELVVERVEWEGKGEVGRAAVEAEVVAREEEA